MRRLVTVVAALVLVLAACSNDSADTGTTPDTGLPDNPDRCEVAPQEVLDYLSTGITSEDVTVPLPWGFTVKSTDYPDVWVVTAGVQIPGDEDFGTWAIRAITWPTDYVGAVAVDEIAKTVSEWGEDTDIIVTNALDGVTSATACAIAKLDNP